MQRANNPTAHHNEDPLFVAGHRHKTHTVNETLSRELGGFFANLAINNSDTKQNKAIPTDSARVKDL
jgi:hypothetical protein